MSEHDFKQLSSRDFEELARDLLQADWGVALEAFTVGRDQGIDLRHISVDRGTTIVQCKHYAGSGYSQLLSRLRSSELEKVKLLRPQRYVLVTSVGLTPPNKDAIQKLFRPYIISPQDIIGADDLNGLLKRHTEVARSNFKLWLTSTEMLERVLHNGEIVQTDFEIERVMRKLPIFVQNAAFPRAQEILKATNALVVSGVPGIGKTTLAEILLYTHLEQGYEPVVIQSDVREGKNRFNSKRRQIFYFDDFLGQTFLGDDRFPGGLNADASLVDFVEMVRATGHSRFILTTREHLLQGAHTDSERLRHSALLDHRCLLALADYSRGQRARILYNHLYFSDLARDYKEQVLRGDFFLKIVAHEHFSPRLIEWLASSGRLRDVPSADYPSHINRILDNPQAIWSHAFNRQISAAARNVLLVLYSNGAYTKLCDLEPMWKPLNSFTAKKYNRRVDPRDYQNALKELDNAFVSYSSKIAQLLNPSVRDMLRAEIRDCPELGVDLISAAGRFRQIVAILDLSYQQGYDALRKSLIESAVIVTESIQRMLHTPHLRQEQDFSGEMQDHYIDLPLETRLVHIGRLASSLTLDVLWGIFEKELQDLDRRYDKDGVDVDEAISLVQAFDKFPELKARDNGSRQRKILDSIFEYQIDWCADQLNTMIRFSKQISVWSGEDDTKLDAAIERYENIGVREEIRECGNINACENLREALSALGRTLELYFEFELQELEERIDTLDRPKPEFRGASAVARKTAAHDPLADSDSAIRDVFGTLLD